VSDMTAAGQAGGFSAAGSGADGANAGRAPVIVITLLILVLMLPIEISAYVGGLFLTPAKVFLLVMAFVVIPKAFTIKLHLFDYLFAAHVFWTALCYIIVYGARPAVEPSGSYILEMLVVYLTARVYLTRLGHLRGTIMALFVMLLVAAAFAIPEAIFKVRFIHDFFSSLTGMRYRFTTEVRMGILRSASFFEHQILYGIFCSSMLSLVWFISTPSQRVWRAPVIGLATFLSASSAPLMLFILQGWLILVEKLSRNIKRRVPVVTLAAVALGTLVEMGSNRGVVGLVSSMTLNPHTAYSRQNQWTYGIQDVMNHPLFGFDPTTWTKPPGVYSTSIDNYWLLMMMRSGFPAIIFLGLAALFIWWALARKGNDVPPLFRQMRIGWGITILAIIIGGATVAYFGKLQPLFAFYLGFGAALASVKLDPAGQPQIQTPEAERGVRYTRFAPSTVRPATSLPAAAYARPAAVSGGAMPVPPARTMATTGGAASSRTGAAYPTTRHPTGRASP